MSKKVKVIALFISDVHLSLTPPIWRSNEPDWLAAQQRPFDELKELQEELGGPPIFCAGDLFDRWNSPPELINWAMKHLPYMHCIPGQHDLPDHDLSQIHRSAYWTLVSASVIHDMRDGRTYSIDQFVNDKEVCVHEFPFGVEVKPPKNQKHFSVALIHEYHWINSTGYKGAPQESHAGNLTSMVRGYKWIVCGDNHLPFLTQGFWNCGCFIRRKSDEEYYKPSIGMLTETGQMLPHSLDLSEDKHLNVEDWEHKTRSSQDPTFLEDLEALDSATVDFRDALQRYIRDHRTDLAIKREIMKALPNEQA